MGQSTKSKPDQYDEKKKAEEEKKRAGIEHANNYKAHRQADHRLLGHSWEYSQNYRSYLRYLKAIGEEDNVANEFDFNPTLDYFSMYLEARRANPKKMHEKMKRKAHGFFK